MAKEQTTKDRVQQRVLSQMLMDAFFTIPSAILIGFSIIAYFLFPLTSIISFWQPWFWIVFGVIAEAIYMAVTVTDPVANQEAVNRALRERFDPSTIKNPSARQRLIKALDYKNSIDSFVSKQSGALKVSLSGTAAGVDDWIGGIYRLAKIIDAYDSNQIIDQDRRTVPGELADLRRNLSVQTDPGVKAELQQAIEIREKLLNDLNAIVNNVKRTDIKIDNTLAQLSTVYAQLQLMNTGTLDSAGVQRLNSEIQNEISSLKDTVSAMSDVYNYKGASSVANDLSLDTSSAASSAVPNSTDNQKTAQGGQSGRSSR